jgi:hypothetical protein
MPLCAWLPGLSSAALPRAIDRALASVARIASARNDSGENGRDVNQPGMAQCRVPRVRVSIVFESGARILAFANMALKFQRLPESHPDRGAVAFGH